MAERSKAPVSGTGLFGGVGSNPTPISFAHFGACGALRAAARGEARHDWLDNRAGGERSSRHLGRVVKAVDSKSTGLCPRQFESGRCREPHKFFTQNNFASICKTAGEI